MKKCPFCGAELSDDSLFCTECGKELPKGNVCPSCGTLVKESDRFCTECGKRLNEAVQMIETRPIPQDITPGENDGIYEEYDKKNFKDYLPYIIAVLVVLALIGGAWWYWDSSSQRAARERAIADSLEVVQQDSIKAAKLIVEKERKENNRRMRREACKNYVAKFYMEYEKADNQVEYLQEHCTYKALKYLKDEYPYDCDGDDCLATWIFFYEGGTDAEIVQREFVEVDENTCIVNNINNYGGVYRVTIGITERNGHFLIDSIAYESL